jgi:hypothetical protein
MQKTIEYFIALAETGNLLTVANTNNIFIEELKLALTNLETNLGTKLVEMNNVLEVSITSAGSEFYSFLKSNSSLP